MPDNHDTLPAPFQSALVLTGPTASGKTGLGIELALRLNAEIVSMDSMALYRGMDVGTAKPTAEQRRLVPHHLIDVLDPWESASVAWWLEKATECCREIESRGKSVLFVGGTPLYLKALMFGLFDGPPADPDLRRRLSDQARESGPGSLHQRLAEIDPPAAQRIHPNDVRRIIRALEVFELTGQPISAWQTEWQGMTGRKGDTETRRRELGRERDRETGRQGDGETRRGIASPCLPVSLPPCLPVCLWLDRPRTELYERINRRVEEMLAGGWVEEAAALTRLERPLSKEASQAVGYNEIWAHLDGQIDRAELIARVQIRTRQFAKRQITWFRHLPGLLPATSELTRELWQPKMKEC